jgi:hypothetical protein
MTNALLEVAHIILGTIAMILLWGWCNEPPRSRKR